MQSAGQALISILLGCVFLCSSVAKLKKPKQFALIVIEFQVVPESSSIVLAALLPPVELLLALLFLSGTLMEVTVCVSSFLLVGFSIGIAVNLMRGRQIDCGCFGTKRSPIGWKGLWRNLFLILAALGDGTLGQPWTVQTSWSLGRVIGLDTGLWIALVLSVFVVISASVSPAVKEVRTYRSLSRFFRSIADRERSRQRSSA